MADLNKKLIKVSEKGDIKIEYENQYLEFDSLDEMIHYIHDDAFYYSKMKRELTNIESVETKIYVVDCWKYECLKDTLVIIARNKDEANHLLKKCLIENYDSVSTSKLKEVDYDEGNKFIFGEYYNQEVGVYLCFDFGVSIHHHFKKSKKDYDEDIFRSGIYGLVVGDALGVPYKFMNREKLRDDPCKDMIGYGTYNLESGSCSSVSSITLVTLDSLYISYNLNKIMEKLLEWYLNDKYICNKELFDVSFIVSESFENYLENKDIYTCGLDINSNDSLMRILPVCIYLYVKNIQINQAIQMIHDCSALTNAHMRSKVACGIYYFIVNEIINNNPLEVCIQKGIHKAFEYYKDNNQISYFNRIKNIENFMNLSENQIKSSEYVVDTLEATIWCLLNNTNYKETVLSAVNLGRDTNTLAAITGGLAGLYYRYNNIPKEWIEKLKNRYQIDMFCRNVSKN